VVAAACKADQKEIMTLIRKTLLALACLTLFALPAQAAATRAIDGDTIEISGETIRLLNIDTPEIRHAQCDAERRLGLVAKQRMQALLDAGALTIRRGDAGRMTDKYGRTLAVVAVDGEDIGTILIAEGLARPWTGRRRPWCQ
jgi:endonuclease YncB( thermonuclease family)